MKITFFGTADGVPRKGHFCTSTMIEIGERVYLIDAGAPVAELMLNHDKHPDQLAAFFNTHVHSDHIVGLLPLITLCGWAFTETRFGLYIPEQRLADAFAAFRSALVAPPKGDPPKGAASDRVAFHVYEAGEIYDDGFLKVTAYPTRHCWPRPSYALMLEAEGKRVFFSGDLSYGLGDYPTVVNEVETDLFVCEMAHFNADQIEPYLEKCRAKTVAFTHVYPIGKYNDIDAMKGRYPFEIITPNDGDAIEI